MVESTPPPERPERLRRPDLAAMIMPLGRALAAAEVPVLREHGLSMWGYMVLLALDEHPVRSQAVLAESIGADKTRIISVLDDLQQRGLIRRQADPADRRARLLSLTTEGLLLRASAQAEIQHREERLLGRLPPGDRRSFIRALQVLSSLSWEEIAGADPRRANLSSRPGGRPDADADAEPS